VGQIFQRQARGSLWRTYQTAPGLAMEVIFFPNGLPKSPFSNVTETGAVLMDVKDFRCLNEQGV